MNDINKESNTVIIQTNSNKIQDDFTYTETIYITTPWIRYNSYEILPTEVIIPLLGIGKFLVMT